MIEEKKELRKLPDGWEQITVGSLYKLISGGTPRTKVEEYWEGDIPWITSADIYGLKDIRPRKKINEIAIRNSATNLVPKGSIIVVTRVGLGKLALTDYPLCFSQDSQALIPKTEKVDPEYALYYLSQAVQIFKYRNRGTTIAGVTKKQLADLGFVLPPLPEQRKIVAKIEELFSQLDAGVAALQQAKAQLQRYRQAVLKAAVTGELTKEWREAHKKQCGITDATGPYPIPAYWTWVTISDIGAVTGGLTKNKKRQSYQLKMPFLRVANVYSNELRLEDVEEIGIQESELKRVLLQKGDLLIVEGNGSSDQIGRVSIWDGSINPCVHQNHIIKVRFEIIEIGRLVMYWLLSPLGREQISKVASSTSGLYTLSLSKVNALPVPLPPMEEQGEILMELEYRLSIIDKLEEQITANLSKTELLRNAILKNAFKGKFSHQNIEDRPNLESLDSIQMKNDHDVYQLMMKGFTS